MDPPPSGEVAARRADGGGAGCMLQSSASHPDRLPLHHAAHGQLICQLAPGKLTDCVPPTGEDKTLSASFASLREPDGRDANGS